MERQPQIFCLKNYPLYSTILLLNHAANNSRVALIALQQYLPFKIQVNSSINTVHGKILVGEKLANCEPSAKIFLANIHRYMENVYGICTDHCLSAKFFFANSFYLHGSPKFSPAKYFPCMVLYLFWFHLYNQEIHEFNIKRC